MTTTTTFFYAKEPYCDDEKCANLKGGGVEFFRTKQERQKFLAENPEWEAATVEDLDVDQKVLVGAVDGLKLSEKWIRQGDLASVAGLMNYLEEHDVDLRSMGWEAADLWQDAAPDGVKPFGRTRDDWTYACNATEFLVTDPSRLARDVTYWGTWQVVPRDDLEDEVEEAVDSASQLQP